MAKTYKNINIHDAVSNVSDLQMIGDPEQFQLLSKSFSEEEDWISTYKAMSIEGIGCVIQVTTQQGLNVAEALTFVPGARIVNDINGGKKLAMS